MDTEAVDPAGIRGRKMPLPGEVSTATGWPGGEISRRRISRPPDRSVKDRTIMVFNKQGSGFTLRIAFQ
ncbi:hypothetical protein RQM65_03325 [Pricia sp. S334]|uniref:Uncharacterized protein n=1 Tax=Pricia mediterranea TaxID=3076079 RepID=A0ABU3L1T7_9FLAO|nr:hypothetical protein [Pricia sp. S334]MDT7827696.1 hypothetical protein [Pricia sp. S334]